MNFSDGGVLETSRRFHAATPASNHPALRPTRGSGWGAETDMSGAGDPDPPDEDMDDAQATMAPAMTIAAAV